MIKKLSSVSPKEKIQPEPLFGINITPSAGGADNAFEIAKFWLLIIVTNVTRSAKGIIMLTQLTISMPLSTSSLTKKI